MKKIKLKEVSNSWEQMEKISFMKTVAIISTNAEAQSSKIRSENPPLVLAIK